MAVDLSVFSRQKSLLDQQALQEAFQARKVQQALQSQALIQQVSGALTPKDQIMIGMQQQQMAVNQANQAAMMDYRQQALGQQKDLNLENMRTRVDQANAVRDEKKDRIMANDQNALTGITTGIDQQIKDLDSLIGTYDANGQQITPPMAGLEGNFGLRGAIPNAPGSDAANAKAKLDQIRAGSFLGGLNQLKAQSATGASGLGAVSEVEGAKVQNAQAALQSTQDLPSLLTNAQQYRQRLLESKQNLLNGFQNVYGGGKSTPMTVNVPNPGNQQILVSNGKETLMIDPADFAAAQAEGFQRQ